MAEATANERLASWMSGQQMTDRELGEKLNLHPTYVFMLRKGDRKMSNGFRWRFARIYGMELASRVLGESVQRPRKQPATANGERT